MKRGQMWSVDVIIGIVIFISIITVFYTTLMGSGQQAQDVLKANADTVIIKFTQDPNLKVIQSGNVLNITKLQQLSTMDYQALKEQLGIEGDFCIYVQDENGRIVPIGSNFSIGKPDINVSDRPCGS